MLGSNRDAVLPQNVLLQKPTYAAYVHHFILIGGLGDIELDIAQISRQALRLCTNLRSFSWVYAEHDLRSSSELTHDLDILRSLGRLKHLVIRTAAGINEEAWTKLTQLPGLQSIELWSARTHTPLFPGWSAKLRESLVSLELGSSFRRDMQLAVLSELPKLKHLRVRGLSNAFIIKILEVLPNLESLYTEYLIASHGRNHPPFKTSLKHLTVATCIPNQAFAEPLWEWILQVLPRPSLETLHIQTVSPITVPRKFLRDLTKIHHDTLQEVNVGRMEMTADDIAYLCTTCPNLQSVSCSLDGTVDDLDAVVGRALNVSSLHVTFRRELVFVREREGVRPEQPREWMLRQKSKLRALQINEVIYEVSRTMGT
ncbi:hypothetical protein EIP91_007752 [Steccherinum ochraceum]|uniref:F-box domain-containing protein n=1 Tax=Steccherinum ochraceum TaxID=92696 RepID=A0A4R0RSU0_9APHY|nr:hypothetical protein EIP91_007752 [Steccherinum ochraceum]